MAETIVTTPTAPPTSPPPPAAPTAAPQSAASRPGVIPDSQFDRLEPAEQGKYARVRKSGDEGGAEWIARDKLPAESTDPTNPATGDSKAVVTPEGFLKLGEMLLSENDVRSLIEQKAQADLRKTQVPSSADAYEARLPEGFQLPAGIEFTFNNNSPELKALQAWAYAEGLTQNQYSALLGHYSNSEASKELVIANAAKAEVEKLGAMGTARVTAVDQWLRGLLGDDHGKAVRGMMVTSKIVEGLEKLQMRFMTQGHASFRQDGREPPGQPGRVGEAEYAAMTTTQKWEYARGFDQKQFGNGR